MESKYKQGDKVLFTYNGGTINKQIVNKVEMFATPKYPSIVSMYIGESLYFLEKEESGGWCFGMYISTNIDNIRKKFNLINGI